MNIRTQLRALILATLLPVAIFGAAGTYVLVEKEREAFARGALARARALMTAIDAELRSVITPLEVLARSPVLDGDDLTAFRAEAARALAARSGDWANVLVSDATTAAMLLNLQIPAGEPLMPTQDPSTIFETVQSRLPTVSKVAVGPRRNRRFAVRVPVLRDGKVKYVLSALVDAAVIDKLVDRQALPRGWAVAVLDSSNGFVVRRPEPPQSDVQPSESLIRAIQSSREGWQRGKLLDGTEIYRAFQHSSLSHWSASIAIPRTVVEQSLQGVWLMVLAFVGAAALGLWIAWKLASRISQPIAALAAAAPALGRGEASALPPPQSLDEVQELSRALGEASVAIRDREERQRLAEQALRDADRAKDEFLAMLGHELRNPLASVSNAAQLLKIARHQTEVVDNVSDILSRQVEHMTRLVDDLLEVGRVTGGKVRIERAPLDLAALAGQIVDTWRSGGRFRHHEVTADLHSVWVSADRARIEQVISNLLDNALKYTPTAGRIHVAVRREEDFAVVELADTGEGMSPGLIGRVFDLFVQGERGLARERGGLGIGLTMAKRLVELHGGTIAPKSEGPGKGATLTVRLPAIEMPARRAGEPPAVAGKAVAQRILIIEDNADARESLMALLRLRGHEVHAAENGAQGIDMASSLAPDCVLVDIGLPDVDGYEVARRLRTNAASRRVRLVALTGYGMLEDRRQALAAGFDEHLAKPVELDALEALLH